MKCDICHEEAKSFVAYRVSKTQLGAACHKCYDKMKRKEVIK